jgi:hypothetical protein
MSSINSLMSFANVSSYPVSRERLAKAISIYSRGSDQYNEIQYMRHTLEEVLEGGVFDMPDAVITSDVGEETDDEFMIRYILSKARARFWVVLSGGLLSPDERLVYLKRIFPEYEGATFGEPFGNITFLRDGDYFLGKVSRFINCGPCSSTTLYSIFESLQHGSKIITVGANDDGTAAGINQKQTDDGVLKNLCWNEYLDKFREKFVVENLSVGVSRYVLLPHPKLVGGDYHDMPEKSFHNMLLSAAMFISSRPPPQFAFRVNVGNSIVVYQLFPNIMDYVGTPEYEYGLRLIEEYGETCNSGPNGNGVEEVAVSAAIPLMVTALLGGVYKPGVFGFSPTDKSAKERVACLTEESVPVFLQNIARFTKFTPGYDLLAVIKAI